MGGAVEDVALGATPAQPAVARGTTTRAPVGSQCDIS
jgi:hypothetical protein